ncbi:MAG TPA: hypothetical protein VF158_04440 [Longimicrobiales bacterium]
MNGWDVFTWVAIAVLIVGAVGVFAWFLRDAAKLFRDTDRRR